jgi:hypothetical protein
MQDEQPRRKPRVPLSAEEVFYVKQIKKLKELKKIEDFKQTLFYKLFNKINIILAGLVSYCILSILICSQWQSSNIEKLDVSYGEFDFEKQEQSISEVEIITSSGEYVPIKTSKLFLVPKIGDVIYIGKDYIFQKTLKVKLSNDNRAFWYLNTYPTFAICLFALSLSFFVYIVNKHLSINGLLTVFGLCSLASLYFILI